jgi:hypothetical protein
MIYFKPNMPDALPCKIYLMTQEEDKALLKFLQEQEIKGYICITILLHTKKRWQITTSTGLPTHQQHHYQQSIPPPTDY